jgi:hypothetical protein
MNKIYLIWKLGSLRLYGSDTWSILPRISISRRNYWFCGGVYGRWLKFSFEYDHLSKAWKVQKEV